MHIIGAYTDAYKFIYVYYIHARAQMQTLSKSAPSAPSSGPPSGNILAGITNSGSNTASSTASNKQDSMSGGVGKRNAVERPLSGAAAGKAGKVPTGANIGAIRPRSGKVVK